MLSKTAPLRLRPASDVAVFVVLFMIVLADDTTLPIAQNVKFGTFSFAKQLSEKHERLTYMCNLRRFGTIH